MTDHRRFKPGAGPLQANSGGEKMINIAFTHDELQELLWLIDDEPVDEVALNGIRKKIRNRMKRLKYRTREGS